MNKKVFISFANKDATYANLLATTLKKKGINVFDPSYSLVAGTNWEENLREELKESDAVIALISDNWTQSHNAAFEYGAASVLDKKIIPVVIDDIKSDIPIDLKRFVTVNAKDEDLESVARQVEKAL